MNVPSIHMSAIGQQLSELSVRFEKYFYPRDASLLQFGSEVALYVSRQRNHLSEQSYLFFELYAQFFILQTMITLTPKRAYNQRWLRELPIVGERCDKRIFELYAEMRVFLQTNDGNRFDESFTELLRFLAKQAQEAPFEHAHWLTFYECAVIVIQRAQTVLENELLHLADEGPERAFVLLALGKDDEAQQLFAATNSDLHHLATHEAVLFFLRDLQASHDWERLKGWLQWLPFRASPTNERQALAYLDIWRTLPAHVVTDEEMERVYWMTHPWSHDPYVRFLLEHDRWYDWLRLHIAYSHSSRTIQVEIPPLVKSKRPDLLTVIYHQEIDRAILDGNGKYEDALMLLKKLHSCYEQQQMLADWRHYLLCIQKKFKRNKKLIRMIEEAQFA